ncbi:MAG: hypothetical protein RR425_02165 [Erysipelotrichales bacterium]
MIKAIKKLFSVDESELDFDEIETSEKKYTLYEKELNQYKEDTSISDISIVEVKGNQAPSDFNSNNEQPIIPTSKPVSKAIEQTNPEILKHNIILDLDEDKTAKRSLDFAKEIEDAFENTAKVAKALPLDEDVQTQAKKEAKDSLVEKVSIEEDVERIITKDNYELKDIISPMRGVVRKEKNTIKRDPEHKKAQIIKLREHVKTTDIEGSDVDDIYDEKINDLTREFNVAKSKKINVVATELSEEEEVHEALSETSKFTLIEDSTGEMKLVIDEDIDK